MFRKYKLEKLSGTVLKRLARITLPMHKAVYTAKPGWG
jgi:hypothetical protein